MEPQPLLDAAIRFEFTSELDRPTTLAQFSRVLSGLFSQMDVGFGLVDEDDAAGRGQAVAAPRYFDETIAVSVQASSILFQTVAEYPGWRSFKQRLSEVLEGAESITGANITIDRILLRYLNFFDESENMSDVVECDLRLPESVIADRRAARFAGGRETWSEPGFDMTVTDHVSLETSSKSGVIVDVSVWANVDSMHLESARLLSWIDRLHSVEKRQFASMLQPTLLDRMTVEWEDGPDD